MILVVGGTGEAAATVGLRAGVGPLACVGAHMYLADIRRGEGAATAFKRAPEWTFTCGDGVWLRKQGHAEQEAGTAGGSRFKSEQGREGRAQPTSMSPDMFLQVS